MTTTTTTRGQRLPLINRQAVTVLLIETARERKLRLRPVSQQTLDKIERVVRAVAVGHVHFLPKRAKQI